MSDQPRHIDPTDQCTGGNHVPGQADSASNSSGPALHVSGQDDLIAAIPHILGFYPENSLVVLAMDAHRLVFTLRVDLPQARHREELVAQLLIPLEQHHPSSVLVMVFGGDTARPAAEPLPQAELVGVLAEALRSIGVPLGHAVWLRSCGPGEPWRCYDDCACSGTMPDPSSSPIAAASAAMGTITFATRDDLAAQVKPVPDDVMARRSALLDAAAEKQSITSAAGFRLVSDAVTDFATRTSPLEDDELIRLTMALSDHRVRDACLSFALDTNPGVSERLWLEMTRGCPVPERAEPAVLLAFAAYLRGDGALASVAIQVADEACPGHRLAGLLRHALDCGLTPARIRKLATPATVEANQLLREGDDR